MMIVRLPFTIQEMHSFFPITVHETYKTAKAPESGYVIIRKRDCEVFRSFYIK